MTAVSPGSKKGTKNVVKIFVNIFISFIGAGVLGLPYSFRQAGIAEGLSTMIFVSYFSVKAMLLLIDCKNMILEKSSGESGVPLIPSDAADSDLTYSEVGYHAAGLLGRRLVDCCIVLSQVGFCCAYLIFITENLNSFFDWMSSQAWLAVLLPLLFLLTLYKELHRLAFFSLFAQISNLLAFAVVFWFDFEHIKHAEKRIHPQEWSFSGFPFFFAVAIYCYEGAGMILALESSVAKEKRHMFKSYFIVTMVLVTGLYIAFGICGYLSFGNQTNPIITLNLPNDVGFNFAMLVKLCLCVSLFFTYPVMMFPVTELFHKEFFVQNSSPLRELCLRLCLVALTGLVVSWIPSFANLMALIGATCCTLLAFILPATFHLLLNPDKHASRLLNYFLIVIGLVGAVIGTMDTLSRLSTQMDSVAQAVDRPSPISNSSLVSPHSNFTLSAERNRPSGSEKLLS